jgi:glutathione S-transferase
MSLYTDSQFTSPYATSAFVALTEKQLPFEVKTIDFAAGANNDREYARTSLTPWHAVPFLELAQMQAVPASSGMLSSGS